MALLACNRKWQKTGLLVKRLFFGAAKPLCRDGIVRFKSSWKKYDEVVIIGSVDAWFAEGTSEFFS